MSDTVSSELTAPGNIWLQVCKNTDIVRTIFRDKAAAVFAPAICQQLDHVNSAAKTESEPSDQPNEWLCSLRAVKNQKRDWSLFVDIHSSKKDLTHEGSVEIHLNSEDGLIFAVNDGDNPSFRKMRPGDSVDAAALRFLPLETHTNAFVVKRPIYVWGSSTRKIHLKETTMQYLNDAIKKADQQLSDIAARHSQLASLVDDAKNGFRDCLTGAVNSLAVKIDRVSLQKSLPVDYRELLCLRSGAGLIPLADNKAALCAVYDISRPASPSEPNGEYLISSVKSSGRIAVSNSLNAVVWLWDSGGSLSSPPMTSDEEKPFPASSRSKPRQSAPRVRERPNRVDDAMSSEMLIEYGYPKKPSKTWTVATGEVELKRSWSNSNPEGRDSSWRTAVAHMQALGPVTTVEEAATSAEETWKSIPGFNGNFGNKYWSGRGGWNTFHKTRCKSRDEGLRSLKRYLSSTFKGEQETHLEIEIGCCVVTATTKGKPPFLYHPWRIKRSGKLLRTSLEDTLYEVTKIPLRDRSEKPADDPSAP